MKVLAIAAQKGGTGKTTLAVHLAVEAERTGHTPAILDLDAQGSAMAWFDRRKASTPRMMHIRPDQIWKALKEAEKAGIDLVILDTAPAHGPDVAAVGRVADLCLIPCRPSVLDLNAIGATVEILTAIKAKAAIVLNACHPGRGGSAIESGATVEARRALEGSPVPACPVSITQRAAMSYALNDGRAVAEFEPDGKAAKEIRKLFEWIKKEIGL